MEHEPPVAKETLHDALAEGQVLQVALEAAVEASAELKAPDPEGQVMPTPAAPRLATREYLEAALDAALELLQLDNAF